MTGKRIRVLAGVVVAAALTTGAVLALRHAPDRAPRPKAETAAALTPSGSRTSTYTITAPVRMLVVTTSPLGGSITITGSQRSTIQVTESLSYDTTPPATRHTLANGTLTLGYTCRSMECGVGYVIEVPRGIAVDATVERGVLTLASLTGTVSAYAGTGSLTATGLGSASATFRVDIGGMVIGYRTAPGSVRATGGGAGITIRLPGNVTYDVNAYGSRGTKVTVRRGRSSRHAIYARSAAGEVDIIPA